MLDVVSIWTSNISFWLPKDKGIVKYPDSLLYLVKKYTISYLDKDCTNNKISINIFIYFYLKKEKNDFNIYLNLKILI